MSDLAAEAAYFGDRKDAQEAYDDRMVEALGDRDAKVWFFQGVWHVRLYLNPPGSGLVSAGKGTSLAEAMEQADAQGR